MFVDQLTFLEVSTREKYIIMILLENLPVSYKYFTMSMEEFMMEYVTACLIHEISKCKEKELQSEDAAMVSRQSKACNAPS